MVIVGDCYVAVCGCPEAREDHAVAMAKFSRECIENMKSLVENEMPEMNMSSLRLRVGMHSGPVTGGMLRGDRSCSNTASQANRRKRRTRHTNQDTTGSRFRIRRASENLSEEWRTQSITKENRIKTGRF